jgi:large subunit ribosomal protein L17
MRHRVKATKLGTDSKHRKALLRSLVTDLLTHGSINTSLPRAKEAQRHADKLIGRARVDSVLTRRYLHQYFGSRLPVNALVDRIAPAFGSRSTGFTRITKLGARRGDNREVVELALVEKPAGLGSLKAIEKAPETKEPTVAKK